MKYNFSSTTPAPPVGAVNVQWQRDQQGNISGYVFPSDASPPNDASPPAGGDGSLLALHSYANGSDTALHTVSTNTMTDMDATNAAVTFTAPASGNVLVECSVLHGNSSSSGESYWGLREASSTIITAYAGGSAFAFRLTGQFYISGLTPGNSYTYKLAHRCTTGNGVAYTGPNYGQVIMTVFAAP